MTSGPGASAFEEILRELAGRAGVASAVDEKLAADLRFQAETLRHVAAELDKRADRVEASAARHSADEDNLGRVARGFERHRPAEPRASRRPRLEEDRPDVYAALVADLERDPEQDTNPLAKRYGVAWGTVERVRKKVRKKPSDAGSGGIGSQKG